LERQKEEHDYFNDKAGKPYIWIRDNKLQFGSYRSDVELEKAKKMEEKAIWELIIGKKL